VETRDGNQGRKPGTETRRQTGRSQLVRACLMRAHHASEGQLCLAGTPRRKAWPTALLRLQPTRRCRFQGSDKLPGTQRPSRVRTFANRAQVRIGIEQDLADIAPLRDVVWNIYDSGISKTGYQTGTISENVPSFSGFSTGLSRAFVPGFSGFSESSGVNPERQSSGINPLLHGRFPFWRERRYRLGQIFPVKDERAGDGPVARVIYQADGWPGDGESFS